MPGPGGWPRIVEGRVHFSLVAIGSGACPFVAAARRQWKPLLDPTPEGEAPRYAYTTVLLPNGHGYTTCFHVYGASPQAEDKVRSARQGADELIVVAGGEVLDDAVTIALATEGAAARRLPVALLLSESLAQSWIHGAPGDTIVHRGSPGSDEGGAFRAGERGPRRPAGVAVARGHPSRTPSGALVARDDRLPRRAAPAATTNVVPAPAADDVCRATARRVGWPGKRAAENRPRAACRPRRIRHLR